MQAISVRFLPCTNYRPNRYVAEAQAGRMVLSEDCGLGTERNAIRAAYAFARRYGWNYGKWMGGQVKDGTWAFVCDCDVSLSFTVDNPLPR